MRTVHLWRRPRAGARSRAGERRSPRSRVARYLLLACCAPLAALTGVAQLAGQAQAVPSRWTVTPTPNRGTGTDQLSGVSCPGPKFCMAVGNWGGGIKTLTAGWNGRAWSIIPSPNPRHSEAPFAELFGVSCTSSSFCVAVGVYAPSLTNQPLVETWNGKAWSITPSPRPSHTPGDDSELLGVSCVSAASCIAVGSRGNSNRGTVTLAESWNGKAWSIVPSPSVNTNSKLDSVSCRSTASCVAVGAHGSSFGMLTLAESWNGSRWSVVPSPNKNVQQNNFLTGVSCPSATSCEAVGGYSVAVDVVRNLAESWNGKRWSLVSIPNRGTQSDLLGGVSCTSAANCVAAGFSDFGPAGGPGEKTLIESWNGSQWAITPSPSPHTDNELYGVACTGAASCEAVGFAGKGSLLSDKTLVETGS